MSLVYGSWSFDVVKFPHIFMIIYSRYVLPSRLEFNMLEME